MSKRRFPNETNHMIGGNLSWETARRRRGACLRHAGARLQGRRLQHRLADPVRTAQFRSRVAVEPRDRLEVRAAPTSPLQLQTDVFYMRRQNMQVYLSEQLQQNNPLGRMCSTPRTRATARTTGSRARPRTDSTTAGSSPAARSLLRTRYLGVTGLFGALDLDGRAQPFAPGYKLSAALEYRHPAGWFARLDASAIDSFYYYTSDAQTSQRLQLGERPGRLRTRFVEREPVGSQSLRCALRPAGLLFRIDPAELSQPILSAAGRPPPGGNHRQLRAAHDTAVAVR